MAYNTSDGGATRLYDAVGGRHLEALREHRGLESVSLRSGVVVGASNWSDRQTGTKVQLIPRKDSDSWMMRMTEVEGWPLCLQLAPGASFLNEPLRVVVDRSEASLATRDRLCSLGSLPVGYLCSVVERMVSAGCDGYTSTLGQAIDVDHSLRRTPEGQRRPEVATAAQILLQKSIDAHRDNPGAGFVVVEGAMDFGGEDAEMFSVRSQAWMPALQCRLELEAVATAGLVISPQADVLATFSFPGIVRWGTLDGPVQDDALGVLLEGTEALVLMESLPSGYTYLDGDSLGRLQEILDHADITPIVPED